MVDVREAMPADRPAIRDVHVASVRGLAPAAYDEQVVAAWVGDEDRDPSVYGVTDEDVVFLVADDADNAADDSFGDAGKVVGFAELTTSDDAVSAYDTPADAEVRAVYVAPDHAGEGVGTALLTELERRGRERGASTVVLTASLNAVEFYERHGYERVTETQYAFGDDADGPVVVMRKALCGYSRRLSSARFRTRYHRRVPRCRRLLYQRRSRRQRPSRLRSEPSKPDYHRTPPR